MTREQAEQIANRHATTFAIGNAKLWCIDGVIDAIMEAAAVEREACAKVCEELDSPYWDDLDPVFECAKAIRARGER